MCNSVDVDIMPGLEKKKKKKKKKKKNNHYHLSHFTNFSSLLGATDPSNFSLPQQPLNPFLLPLSAPYSSLRRVSNPYDCGVGGMRFLGTSGQPLADLENYMQVFIVFFSVILLIVNCYCYFVVVL